MVILGLVLIVLGAGAIVSAVFTAEIHGGQVQLLGFLDMSPLTFFLVGVAAGLAVWFGLVILRWGMKRARAERKVAKAGTVDQDIRTAEKNNRRTL